jgi:hypothetical protein
MLETCRVMIRLQVPQWLCVILFFWVLTYLSWKVFLYPNYRRGDGGGYRPRSPRPIKGPGIAKPEPIPLTGRERLVHALDFSHLN